MLEKHKALHRYYIEEINKGNLDVLDEYMSSKCICYGSGEVFDNMEASKKQAASNLRAFPDRILIADDMIAADDKVITRWTWTGTHKGQYQGIEPSGKRVTVTGITISRIEDGKVVEEWEEVNRLGLLKQLDMNVS